MRRRNPIPNGLSIALACAWLFGGPTREVLAQSSVEYEAPSTCPGREAFMERVRARLRVDGTRLPVELVLRVTLALRGAGTHGTVELARGATKTQRSVDAGRCEEVVEALALITALALHDHDARENRRERVRKANKTDPRTASSDRIPAPAATSPKPAAAAEGGTTTPAPPAPTPAAETAPAAKSSVMTTAAPTGSVAATPAASAPPLPAANDASAGEPWQFTTSTGASFVAFSGLAPALQLGLQLQAAFGFSSSALAWTVQLGARMARQDRLISPEGEAWFGFAGGVVRVCGASALGSTPIALSGCAVAEPGVFSAGGENTANPRSHTRAWLALGGAAQLSLRLTSWLSLQAGVELLAPLRRDRMSLAGDTLYRVPRLGSRLQIGLEIPFG